MNQAIDLTQEQLLAILLDIHEKSKKSDTLQMKEIIEEIKGRILMISK
ncbi:hypothetical protein [Paenibacillus spongiae]|uniref:Sporulation histidine kinase inhibitor Sda n=1 Tax=Paenibacillus spongiae TaxID=2909671 RepID=A0ABY5SDB8_9BACL|nr:hypothetical protein [Paenibacillus spongiae]UVI31538.1 hypothetical protein L1F29_06875 [Paenibacillus spongiae]